MPTVTNITPVKGMQSEIEFDDSQILTIDRETAALCSVAKGIFLTDERIDEIKLLSEQKRAKSRAMWYLSRSDCSKKGMLIKLTRAGFLPAACSDAVDKLCELGFIDDERFADRLAKNYAAAYCSEREIYAKLLKKHIPSDIAKCAAQNADCDPKKAIKAIVERKYLNKLMDKDKRKNVFAALCRKGFSFDDIKSVLNTYSDMENDYEI